MLPIVPIIVGTSSALDILAKAKKWLSADKTIEEAEGILNKRVAADVGSLQEQVRDHRSVIDKLVEQVKADKDMLEEHNEILIRLSEEIQRIGPELAGARTRSYWAIGIGALALLGMVVIALAR